MARIGSTIEPRLTPDSPQWEEGNDRAQCTMKYVGSYDALQASRPAQGSAPEGAPSGYKVQNVAVHKTGPAGQGMMVVTLAYESTKDEILWNQVQVPLKRHPMYQEGGEHALTPTDWAHVQGWEQARKRTATNFVDDDGNTIVLSESARHLIGKLLRGIESYLDFYPVARRTTVRTIELIADDCGRRSSPPFVVPFGYDWLKTNDYVGKSGTGRSFERIQEWTGCRRDGAGSGLWGEDVNGRYVPHRFYTNAVVYKGPRPHALISEPLRALTFEPPVVTITLMPGRGNGFCSVPFLPPRGAT